MKKKTSWKSNRKCSGNIVVLRMADSGIYGNRKCL